MAEFDLKQLIAKAHFGHVGLSFPVWYSENKGKLDLANLKSINAELLNGGKYFMQVKFKHQGQIYDLPNEPLVGLSLSKTIIETATVNKSRKGRVKEYINTQDYEISLRGICINDEDIDSYPSDQVDILNRLFEIDDAVEVVANKFFDWFGIRNVVLKDIQFDEMAGQAGMQRYSILAVSTQDFYADLSERGLANLKKST